MTRTISLNLLNVDTFYKGSSARDRGPKNLEIWLGGTGKATATLWKATQLLRRRQWMDQTCFETQIRAMNATLAPRRQSREEPGEGCQAGTRTSGSLMWPSAVSSRILHSLHTSCGVDTVWIWVGKTVHGDLCPLFHWWSLQFHTDKS